MVDITVEIIKWLLRLADNIPLILALGSIVLILIILLELESKHFYKNKRELSENEVHE